MDNKYSGIKIQDTKKKSIEFSMLAIIRKQ